MCPRSLELAKHAVRLEWQDLYDNNGLDEDDWQLHVADFAAFGEYTEAQIPGYTKKIFVTSQYEIFFLSDNTEQKQIDFQRFRKTE